MDLWGREDAEEYAARIKREVTRDQRHYENHDALVKAASACDACPLRQEGCLGPVVSTGPAESPMMIVGEGPGAVEDSYGAPLIGPSGQLLDKALFSVGITRDRIYVTNVVKCRPRGNRTPTLDEGKACGDRWLAEEIDLNRPKVIVALGKVALRYFLGHEAGIIRIRGHWFEYRGIPVMPTFHPSYLLRQFGHDQVEAKWKVYYDLKAARDRADQLAPGWQWTSGVVQDLLAGLTKRQEGV
ncbi:MAG: uracil-DNA glycosylase [Dialister sp.]|nr:uracil-DNA glycosylase [Dialister sp.]